MEINIETAVRICPSPYNNNEILCVQPNTYNNTVQLGNAQNYPANHVIPADCCQSRVFTTVISPLLNYFFEGCDVSVVTTGQSGTGKTYTLLGPGLHCALSESEHGVIPRFIREVFMRIMQNRDRNSSIHITWSQICGENVQDLLGTGSVECMSISEAFELIQLGISNIAPKCAHTLFTITLEQQWVCDNTIQHRVSTASFADLAGGDKMLVMDHNGVTQAISTDSGLLALQRCVFALTEPYASQYNFTNTVPYNQSVLTTLLKDSFGGRAKTVLICCISPLLRDFTDTYYTLQFAIRSQMVKNIVTINSYTTFDNVNENMDVFGLQFAANQLLKLVSNAEEVFQKLVTNGHLPKNEMDQIVQWLTLKQECEECLSESSEPHRSLERIEEEIEDSSDSSENEVLEQEESDTLMDRLDLHLEDFRNKTDALVSKSNRLCQASCHSATKESIHSSNSEYHSKGARGRRGSIHSADELTPHLQSASTAQILEDSISEAENKESTKSSMTQEMRVKLIKQISSDLQGYQKQINELLQNIEITENLLQKLEKRKDIKTSARGKIAQKCIKLQNDYEAAQSKLAQAQTQNNHILEEKCKSEVHDLEQKLKEAESVKIITDDSIRKVMEFENSLHTSRKQLEKLRKYKRRDEKRLHALELQLKEEKKTFSRSSDLQKSTASERSTKNSMKNSTDATALVLLKKSDQSTSTSLTSQDFDCLRHEIRDLRRNREKLLEQRFKIHNKATNKKIVSEIEERKLLQYEEAIEAIDLAIEYKNGLICGHFPIMEKLHDTDFSMLLEIVSKLNENEMRILLQRYYEKIIDLRSSSKKLEMQVMGIECQNENLARRVQKLSQTLQQVRLEDDRRIISLQQQYEDRLHLIMRHLANDGGDERVMSQVVERSKQAAIALQVAGGNKQMDKSSLIARFTRYRHQTVPRQLQAVAPAPQAKVTRQKNKLIIQQSTK